MEIKQLHPSDNITELVEVLNRSHGTVAEEFGFTKETNPTNNAFIDATTLKNQMKKGIDIFGCLSGDQLIGCIAIEKSVTEPNTYYLEKVSVIPEYRHGGYGTILMNFALSTIKEAGGQTVSIALIDSNSRLKHWYELQGFMETGIRDFSHLPFRVCFMRKNI
jgi:diamine N-acetyltransferase